MELARRDQRADGGDGATHLGSGLDFTKPILICSDWWQTTINSATVETIQWQVVPANASSGFNIL